MRSKCYCKSCGAAIIFVTTKGNSWMPIDYKPQFDNAEEFDPQTMTSHFATCDHSDKHRRPKEKVERIKNPKIRGNKRSAFQNEMGLTTKKTGMNA